MESERAITYPGQASWAAPYGGTCCRECKLWAFDGYLASGMIKPARCTKAVSLMGNNSTLPRVPDYAGACKYFEENPSPPAAYKERR
jgi:hypothetical protein